MANLDPRIEAVRVQYGLRVEDFWELPQKRGTWVAKHAALEVAAAKAGIRFDAPQVLEADGASKSAALCVMGYMGDRSEWSIGEASPANNKNSYPFAMAEKRGKDRVILKLIGLNGLAYSEDEADDFKQPTPANTNPDAKPALASRKQPFDDSDGQLANTISAFKVQLSNCTSQEDIQDWVEHNKSGLDKIRKHNLEAFNDLRNFKENRIVEIAKEQAA